jgi:hypothetical protein
LVGDEVTGVLIGEEVTEASVTGAFVGELVGLFEGELVTGELVGDKVTGGISHWRFHWRQSIEFIGWRRTNRGIRRRYFRWQISWLRCRRCSVAETGGGTSADSGLNPIKVKGSTGVGSRYLMICIIRITISSLNIQMKVFNHKRD